MQKKRQEAPDETSAPSVSAAAKEKLKTR